jgi:hypothetical protein
MSSLIATGIGDGAGAIESARLIPDNQALLWRPH